MTYIELKFEVEEEFCSCASHSLISLSTISLTFHLTVWTICSLNLLSLQLSHSFVWLLKLFHHFQIRDNMWAFWSYLKTLQLRRTQMHKILPALMVEDVWKLGVFKLMISQSIWIFKEELGSFGKCTLCQPLQGIPLLSHCLSYLLFSVSKLTTISLS